MAQKNRRERRVIRKRRIRSRARTLSGRPRLSVFRSTRHLYCQIIDDITGKTLVSAGTQSKELKGSLKKTGTVEAAKQVGELLAKKAKEGKITKVRFDRGGYMFHGRIKALAETARENGLDF